MSTQTAELIDWAMQREEEASDRVLSIGEQVLATAPGLFALSAMSSGAAAITFEYIRKNQLFKRSGHNSMVVYAYERLGVRTTAAYKKVARAGRNAWEHLPALCERIVSQLCEQGVTAITAAGSSSQTVPNETVLSHLGRALRGIQRSQHPEFLERVLAGHVNGEQMRAIGSHRKASPLPRTGEPGQVLPALEPSTATLVRAAEEGSAAGEINEALRAMGEAERLLRCHNPALLSSHLRDNVEESFNRLFDAMKAYILQNDGQSTAYTPIEYETMHAKTTIAA